MQKVLDFLEMYCQWVAVGIAAAFFLFALWQFLPGVSDPLAIPIGGQAFSPGAVDPHILENDVQPLQQAMSGTATFTAAVPPYVRDFTQQFDGPTTKSTASLLPAWMLAGSRFKLPESIVVDEKSIRDPANNPGVGNRVQSLPMVAAAKIDPAPTTGFAQIPANYTYGMAPPPPAPAAVPGQPTPAGPPTKDVTWVRVPYTISVRQMGQAFQLVGVPANSKTRVLAVELIRQQELPGDNWGPEEVVKTLPTVQLQPMPPANAQPPVQLAYATWADANQGPIIQPPFFPFMGGEDPNVAKPVEVNPADAPFDPATYKGSLADLKPEQKAAVLKARQEAQRAKQAAQPRPTPQPRGPSGPRGPRGGGGGRGFPGEGAPREALPPAGGTFAQSADTFQNRPPPNAGRPPAGFRPPYEGQQYPGGVMPGEEGGPPGMPGEPGYPQAPGVGTAIQLAPLPQSPFDPTQVTADIQGVAYDVDAKSDATYRYRVRVYLFNPLYQSQNVAANKAFESQLAIVAEKADEWSDPLEIAPLTHLFLARKPSISQPTVQFTMYRWQNGKVHRATQSFGPGDSVGKVDGDVDYRTPWTLVEVRSDSSEQEPYAVLMNSEGRLRRQTFTADEANPDRKKLAAQVDTTPGSASASAAGATGGPP